MRRKRMSVKSMINIDIEKFNKLKADELRDMIRKMSIVSERRIKTLEKNELYTPAYYSFMNGEVDLTTKNGKFTEIKKPSTSIDAMTIQELRSEFRRQKNFLKAETSTVKGYKEYRRDVIRKMKEEGIKITQKQYGKFFTAYERLRELDSSIAERGYRYSVFKTLSSYIIDKKYDIDEAVIKIYEELENIYEKQAEIDASDEFLEVSEEEW